MRHEFVTPLIVVDEARGAFVHYFEAGRPEGSYLRAPLAILEAWLVDHPGVEVNFREQG